MTVLRFAAPVYPGGRHCLLCGTITVGEVFPPIGAQQKWQWRLFPFGANPSREGQAKDEATAKGHLTAAFTLTLVEARLAPRQEAVE